MHKLAVVPRESLGLLSKAIAARSALFEAEHACPLRLFNGFYEGNPDLVIDLYGRTLVTSPATRTFSSWLASESWPEK